MSSNDILMIVVLTLAVIIFTINEVRIRRVKKQIERLRGK